MTQAATTTSEKTKKPALKARTPAKKPAPAAKQTAARKTTSTATTTAAATNPSPRQPRAKAVAITADQRLGMIAEAAYLRAEQRGFMGGDEVTDWLNAEAEVDARLASQKIKIRNKSLSQ